MTKDRYERKAYRKSPGRQYGYDYDPLRNQRGGSSQHGKSDASTLHSRGGSSSRPSGPLAQRPDPRRTRQLLRQNILAGKAHSDTLNVEGLEQQDELEAAHPNISANAYEDDFEDQEDSTLFRNRYRARANRPARPSPSVAQQVEEPTEVDEWNEFDFVDPDIGYEDPLDHRVGYEQSPSARLSTPRSSMPSRRQADAYQDAEELAYEDDLYEDESGRPYVKRKSKKTGVTRRKLLVGLGVAAVGGVAAYELGPRIPKAIQDVGNNLEHQVQDAYNRGLTAGANAVRKEFLTALDNLEGYSLGAAINVAKLTRLAYDAFVSPLITLAATVTGDFLNLTLQALKSARGFLSKFNQDNDSLSALQTVLETWVKQVHNVPKEWQTITDTDLDGAQGYLRALQRKIQEEQAKLNSNEPPSTPAP
ncbi:MAG TPA: hypothetical protein VK667_06345, partial [Ktedonobacteraceae bacterium]|nr:hypothetical protein [Ktedonobacteraceae bacterium]